jgi:hypothetical protein
MACSAVAFHNEVIDIGLDITANLWLENLPSHSGESWACIFKLFGICTKQKVPKGVMKLVFSSSSLPSNTDGSRKTIEEKHNGRVGR